MLVMVVLFDYGNRAAVLGNGTAYVFELDGSVGDAVAMFEQGIQTT